MNSQLKSKMSSQTSKIDEMDEIVISGIAGKFPESENLDEFRENLFAGVDMITDDERRWKSGIYGLPTRTGKLKQLDKFDADFFGVHAKQGNSMDPQLRILLELVYEAIMDAGVNPAEIRGSQTGVFIGCSASESEKEWFKNCHKVPHGYTLTGCHRGMFSNRVSFTFNFYGPSFTVDTACSSSLVALSQAVSAMKLGHCDAAIVGGIHVCLEPEISLQYNNLKMLAADGKCKAFDASANGYVRSEAVVAIFLQKKRVAFRLYATLLGTRTNCDGYKDKGITYPSRERQMALLEDTYKEAGINPAEVLYVEAHGTGTQAGDKEELTSLATFFCRGRQDKNPLLVGSVKSNMGHSEPSSGLCSIAKILLAIEQGIIPGNLHFNIPNPNIPALQNGQLNVTAKNTPFEVNNTILGVNSFGFGGANVHAILKSPPSSPHEETKLVESNLPYVVPYSGRTKEAVEFFLEHITSQDELDVKKMALLHEIHNVDIPGFDFRGYALIHHHHHHVKGNNSVEINNDTLVEEIKNRPVWFIFNGMGSQWPTMGKNLLNFPVCAESLETSAKILSDYDLDLLKILTDPKDQLENVLHAFVAITSVQIALVDLLRSLNIEPHGIIGHSVGELACAYADNCLTKSQTILAAYWRGQAILESSASGSAVEGAMAAVGLTWEEAKAKCPAGIYPACHNSKDSVTISGPLVDIKNFVAQLQSQNIFAREVNSSGQAFHSKYIEPSRPTFKKYLDKIIPQGKIRSSRWISSSIPEDRWSSDLSKYSSADYHVNNLISPVLFKEALEKIPEDSIVIEIGPHALLQAILKRSLPKCSNIGLLNKTQDSSSFLCNALGKMYNCGLNPTFANLYPKIEYPVFIQKAWAVPLVRWNHSSSWNVPKFSTPSANGGSLKNVSDLGENFSIGVKIGMEFSLESESGQFLVGNQIDGQILFPAAGYVFIIWKAFAKLHNVLVKNFPVVLENFQISRATVLDREKGSVQFQVNILPGSGHFEIQEQNTLVVSGNIRRLEDEEGAAAAVSLENLKKIYGMNCEFPPTFEQLQLDKNKNGACLEHENFPPKISLSRETVYKELRLRGYEYTGEFQGIMKHPVDPDGGWSILECFWDRKSNGGDSKIPWISFLDTVFQLGITDLQPRAPRVYLPNFVDTIILHPEEILGQKFTASGERDIPVHFDRGLNCITGAGVQISGMKMAPMPRKADNSTQESLSNSCLKLEKFKFTPYLDEKMMDQVDENCLGVCVQIVLENFLNDQLKVLEFIDADNFAPCLIPDVQSIILNQPSKSCQGKVVLLNSKNVDETSEKLLKSCGIDIKKCVEKIEEEMKNINLLICTDEKILEVITISMQDEAFVLYKSRKNLAESENLPEQMLKNKNVILVAQKIFRDETFYLCKKIPNYKIPIANCTTTETVEINLKTESRSDNEGLRSGFCYKWVNDLKSAMKKAVEFKNTEENDPGFRIYIISKNSADLPSGALGLINSLRKEPGGEKIRCFFIQNDSPFQNVTDFPAEILQRDLVMNVHDSNSNVWGSYRFYPIKTSGDDEERLKLVQHAFLTVQSCTNSSSSVRWIESPLKFHQPQTDVCAVYCASLNFQDVMLHSGKCSKTSLSFESPLGLEFSGKDSTGRRIMGVVSAQGLGTSILPDPELLWAIPSQWTLNEGATVPVAYATAYYALCVRGGLKSGEAVLIHNGADPTGIASITIALSMGCSVFTTVDSLEKKEFLQQLFPQLNESCVINTTDSSFLQQVLRQTEGRGVDLVLNGLAKTGTGTGAGQLQSFIKCLTFQGRFLEIGNMDSYKNPSSFGMSILLKNISVHEILLESLKSGDPEKLKIRELVQTGIDSGVVQPLPFIVFSDSVEDVEKAFVFMANKKHRGKVLIEIRKEEEEQDTAPQQKIVKAIPRCFFDPSKSYIVVGGLGGFGLELCGWLIQRGVRKLVLVSRSGVRNGYQDHLLRTWRNLNPPAHVISITTRQADVTTLDGAFSIMRMSLEAFDGAPIGGIWNLGMVLADGFLENQTPENFDIVSRPKVNCSIAMDKASRQLAPFLDHFVVFSSVVSGRGAPGLSNYAWANSAQERICENRRKNGLTGLAIMWGAIGDVGVLQDEKGMRNQGIVGGTCPQRIQSCLQTLDILIHESESNPDSSVLSSLVLPEKRKDDTTKSETGSSSSEKMSNESPRLVESVARILGLRPGEEKKVPPKKKLADMGLDSLISMEVKQLLEVNVEGLILTSNDILGLTFEKIDQLENTLTSNLAPVDRSNSNSNSNSSTPSGDCIVNIDKIEIDFCHKKQQDEFSTTTSKAKSKSQSPIEFPIEHTCFFKDTLKKSRGLLTRPSTQIHATLSYLKSISILFFIGFLCAISLIFRQIILVYIKLFQSSVSLKLMDGPFEQIFAHNPRGSNMIIVVKLGGIPDRSKIMGIIQERVLNLKIAQPDGAEYAPYDSLLWRISPGIFFNYWRKDATFDLENHIISECCPEGMNLDAEALKLSDFYSSHEWDDSKPQWRFHILAPDQSKTKNHGENSYQNHFSSHQNQQEENPEFLLIFSLSHAYGDAYSFESMIRQCFLDSVSVPKFKSNIETQSQASTSVISLSQIISDVDSENCSRGSSTRVIFSSVANAFSKMHLTITEMTRIRSAYQKSRLPFSKNPGTKKQCAILRLPLSQIKSVRHKRTENGKQGKPAGVSAVILHCLSTAYERIYNEVSPSKLRKVPENILTYIPNSIFPYEQLNFTNNYAVSYTSVPIRFNSQKQNHTQIISSKDRLETIQKNLTDSTELNVLKASYFASRVFSLLTNQFKSFAYSFLPTPTFLYTSVPLIISGHGAVTYLGGHEIKEFYGFSTLLPGSHGAMGSMIDSVKDTVILCLILDETVIQMSPEFKKQFFNYFQQELAELTSEKQIKDLSSENLENENDITRL